MPLGSRDVASWIERQLPRLTDDIHARVLATIPAYGDPSPVPAQDLKSSITANLRFVVDALARPDQQPDLATPTSSGARRARQGMPLPEVLLCYRLTFAELWAAIRDRAPQPPQPDPRLLLDLAERLWQLSDEHALALTEGYRTATSKILISQQRRRDALVEALFTGHRQDDLGPWETAQLLGLPPDSAHLVIAAQTRATAEESLPGIESRLSAIGLTSAWRLTPALQLGLVATPPDRHDDVVSLLREVATARTGVSPLFRALQATPRALNLARTALGTIPADTVEVRVFSASPLAAAVAQNPVEARRLVDEVFSGLRHLTAEDREVLLETLRAYLGQDGSVERTGMALHCHPNTVRYRLRRLHQLTGRSTSEPAQAAELAAASYALATLPQVRGDPGRPPWPIAWRA